MITPAFNMAQTTPRRDFSKIVQVPLPDLGEGTKDATVKEWFVKPGDKIQEVSIYPILNNWTRFEQDMLCFVLMISKDLI
jgi:hypothetical protein